MMSETELSPTTSDRSSTFIELTAIDSTNNTATDQQRDDDPIVAIEPRRTNANANANAAHEVLPSPSPSKSKVTVVSSNGGDGRPSTTAAMTVAPGPATTATAAAYHPQFMFCGACTTCAVPDGGNAPAPPPPNMLMQIPKFSKKKRMMMKRKATMVYVSAATGSDEEGDDDNDNNDNDNEEKKNGNDGDRLIRKDENHEVASIFISNLTSKEQIMLINSVLDPTEDDGGGGDAVGCGGKGVFSVRTYLHEGGKGVERSKTVDVVFDPIIISLDAMVKSLRDLGLNAKGSITQRSRTNHQNIPALNGSSASSSSSSPSRGKEQKTKKKGCRSSLYVEGICCATEVPQVTNILRNASAGVKKVRINITSRMVYVDHDPKVVSIFNLADQLNHEGFGATVKKDGGASSALRTQNLKVGSTTTSSTSKGHADDTAGNHHGSSSSSSHVHDSPTTVTALQLTPVFVESTLMAPCLSTMEDVDSINDVLDRAEMLSNKIRYVEPNIASRTIKVEHNPRLVSAQKVADTLMDVGGYSNVTVLVDGQSENLLLPKTMESIDSGKFRRGSGQRQWCQLHLHLPKGMGLNIVLSGIFWIVSLFGHFVEKWSYLGYFGILSVMFGIPPVAKKAYRTIRRKHFDANCMMVTAAFGAVALQQYDEAASVSFLFAISEFLEDQATRRARKALDTIINLRPDHANLIDPVTGDIIIIPSNDLEVGSLVSVRTGDKIPSDGIVEEGSSQVDESSLTGEAVPIGKKVGDTVSGGTINAGNTRLVVRTTSLVEDSAVSRLIRLVEESASNRSPTEQIVDAFARSYTPTVICAAILMCTIPWFFGVDEGRKWALNGLIVVVIACPCALTISTPVTYAAGLAATAQKGIIVKGGARLEALGSVKTIVFDKTGTLTEGNFKLLHLDTVGNQKARKDVLELLALMEAPSSHPLAATLVKAAKSEGVEISSDSRVINHSILKGEGVTAQVDNDEVYVGNIHLFKRLGFYDQLDSAQKKRADGWNEEGGTVGFIGIKTIGIIGMFCVADGVRKEAKDVVTSLINDGVNVLMLTGDGDGAARAVAREVGLPNENVYSQFLPEDKLHYVASLLGFSRRKGNLWRKKELLLFCGDGVNDAPALAVADVGVAMGEGAALAMEMSDVTLMDSNLTKLLFSIKMGTKVVATVQENIAVSVAFKLVVIALTFAGRMSLLGAIAADVGVMLLVSVNGMKLLPGGTGLCCKRRHVYEPLTPQQISNTEIV